MSSSTTRPSIFTPRDAFKSLAAEPQRNPTRPPRTSSPFGQHSTPGALERDFLQAAVVEAAPLVLKLPKNRPARVVNARIGEGHRRQSGDNPDTSVWDSFGTTHCSGLSGPVDCAEKGRSASASHLVAKTSPPPTPAFSPLEGIGRKRYAGDPEQPGPASEPSHKRPRLQLPYKHYLPGYRFTTSDLKRGVELPSPLFFSNSPQPRPSLPPRFSSSEAAATMLSKAGTEDSHVKTVSLARGVLSASGTNMSPPVGAHSPRPSVDRSTTGRSTSPDPGIDREPTNLLNSIGVLELLEQDERPTFIVDLADSSNYGSTAVRPYYVNHALRSHSGLEALIAGRTTASDTVSSNFADFRAWTFASATDSSNPATLQSYFSYAGFRWSCSTLRRRVRIVTGAAQQSSPPRARAALESAPTSSLADPKAPFPEPTEAADYFGPSSMVSDYHETSDSSSFGTRTVVPTIEQSTASAAHPTITPEAHMGDTLLPPHKDLGTVTQLLPGGATYVPNSPKPASESSPGSSVDRIASHIPVVPADSPSFDWTRLPVTDSMPAHIRFARSIDWASTSLGPIQHWSSDLRQMCNLIMASPHPAAM